MLESYTSTPVALSSCMQPGTVWKAPAQLGNVWRPGSWGQSRAHCHDWGLFPKALQQPVPTLHRPPCPPPIRWPWFSPTTPPQQGLTELSTQIQVLGPLPGPLWLLYFQPTPPVTPCPSNTVNVLEPIFDLPCPGRVMVGLPPPHPGPSVGPSLKSGKENDRFPHNLGTQGALHGNPGRAGTCV